MDDKNSIETGLAIKLVDLCVKEDLPIFESRITEECLSIYNVNGTIRKIQKSKLKDLLTFNEINPLHYVTIVDAGYFWRLSTPKSEEYQKNDGSLYTWRDYAVKMFKLTLSRHPNAKSFIWVNDYYGSDVVNIKDSETSTRKQQFSGGESPNVFPAEDKELPSIRLFKEFFKNNANKQRLQIFLCQQFHSLCTQHGVSMVYCTRKTSMDISSLIQREKPEFINEKLEADNAIFYIYNQLRIWGEDSPVVIDAEDMDIIITSAYVSTQVPGVLGIKRRKIICDSAQLCTPNLASIAVRAYVVSGCDSISAYFGKGKKSIWPAVQKSEEAQALLRELTEESLRKFTIKFVYNDKKSETLAEMRQNKWKKIKKKKNKFERIGIDEDSHSQRSKRVAFVVKSIENFRDPSEYGNPLDNGYVLNEHFKCVPLRYTKDALPDELLQTVSGRMKQLKESEKESKNNVNEEEDEEETTEEEEDEAGVESEVNDEVEIDEFDI